ncbi:hypothetical protein K501DRAFT_326796 [Backusella circina FSU 941]|nr:hypothetical protein K501DRAFT_326796 [Backusella circina FSU 941]
MTIIGSLPLFSILSSQTRSDRIRKSIGPISSVLKRQPFSTSPPTSAPHVNKATSDYHHFRQERANIHDGPEVITESSILSNYPRPNLMPTLHFSLFGSPASDNMDGQRNSAKKCSNCSGPHSTDFCPC